MEQNSIDIDFTFGENVSKQGIAFTNVKHELVSGTKASWRDKADTLSRQYTGTDSTISKVSQDGKEGLMGKINHKITSVQRVLINTVYDNSD